MDANTAITTAARQITRGMNATPRVVSTWWAKDGRYISSFDTGTSGRAPEDAFLTLAGRKGAGERWTYRRVQDLLDAHAWADEQIAAGDREYRSSLVELYLDEVTSAREAGVAMDIVGARRIRDEVSADLTKRDPFDGLGEF